MILNLRILVAHLLSLNYEASYISLTIREQMRFDPKIPVSVI